MSYRKHRTSIIAVVTLAAGLLGATKGAQAADPKAAAPAGAAKAKAVKVLKNSARSKKFFDEKILPKLKAKSKDASVPVASLSADSKVASDISTKALTTGYETILDGMGDTFTQFGEGTGPQTVVTASRAGNVAVFYYPNEEIGYINPSNGDLLYCDFMVPAGRSTALNVIDCYATGNINDYQDYTRYSNGEYLRYGSTFYHMNGSIMRSSSYNGGQWYHEGAYDGSYGQRLSSSSSSSSVDFFWPNGNTLYSQYYGYVNFSDGARLYDRYYTELRFRSGGSFYRSGTTYYNSPNYTLSSSSGNMYYPNSYTLVSSYSTSRYMYYDNGYTRLKYESPLWNGTVYDRNGYVVINVKNEYIFSYGGVYIEADRTSDMVAVEQEVQGAFHVRIENRFAPPLPPAPVNLAVSSIGSSSANVSWDSGGGSTASFRFAYGQGTGTNLTCSSSSLINVGSSTSRSLTSLASNTQYAFIVCPVNSAGVIGQGAILSFRTQAVPPGAPYSIAITNIKTTSANVSWSSGGNTNNFRFSIVQGSAVGVTCSMGQNIGYTLSRSLTNLNPNTQYSIMLCAESSDGLQSAPQIVPFSTPAIVYPPAPMSAAVIARAANSITLSWASGGGNTYDFQIRYLQGSIPPNCSSGLSGGTSSSPSKEVLGLAPQTQYSFAVCARNSEGYLSGGYATASAITKMATPPAVVGLAVSNKLDTTARISWASGGGTTIGYRVARANGSIAPACPLSGNTTATFIAATGLVANTTYTYSVCSVNAEGTLGARMALTFTTLPPASPAPAPSAVRSTLTLDTNVTLAWTSGGGNTSLFYISRAVGTVAPACGAYPAGSSTVPSYKVVGLVANTTYTFSVCANNAYNLRSPVATLTVKTLVPATYPPAPLSLVVAARDEASIRVNWAAAGGNTNGYRVAIAAGTAFPACSAAVANGLSLTKTWTGLKANTPYAVSICSVNVYGLMTLARLQTSTTAAVAPPAPRPVLGAVTETTVRVNWPAAGGYTNGYRVAIAVGTAAPACPTSGGIGNVLTTLFSGLRANTQYAISICSVTANNMTSRGTILAKTPVAVIPPAVVGLTKIYTTNQVGARWTSGGGNTQDFIVSYSNGTTPPASCTGGIVVSATQYVLTSNFLTGSMAFTVCARSVSGLISAPMKVVASP